MIRFLAEEEEYLYGDRPETCTPSWERAVRIALEAPDAADDVTTIHRDYPGEHDRGAGCWCRPLVLRGPVLRDHDELIAEMERCDG